MKRENLDTRIFMNNSYELSNIEAISTNLQITQNILAVKIKCEVKK